MKPRTWAVAGIVAVTASMALSAGATQGGSSSRVSPVHVVILVDESGSLSPEAVEKEREAASLLALAELSPSSKVSIIGFGSSNAEGQEAVEQYCGLVRLSTSAQRQKVANCAGDIHRRDPHEGNDTDHVAAIKAAIDTLSTDEGAFPIVFLLTDGILDVSNSERYGPPHARNREAARQLRVEILPDAKRAGIQIWPLGFGDADLASLTAFAAGGAGVNPQCSGVDVAGPRARVVTDLRDVSHALLASLGNARCAYVEDPSGGNLGGGQTVELKVRISPIATDGAIVVTKVDGRVRVRYVDPSGQEVPTTGEVDDQVFDVSGEDGTVEVLQITNPKPGEWTVRLEAPPGLSRQPVEATAIWQGALRSAIEVSPSFPQPGQEMTLGIHVLTRDGVLDGGEALERLDVSALVSGEGFAPFTVDAVDTGAGADEEARDGEFSGGFTLPESATGAVEIRGSVAAPGVAGDNRPYHLEVNLGPDFYAQVVLREEDRVEPGQTLEGSVTVENEGQEVEAVLSIADVEGDSLVTLAPSRLTIPSGRSEHAFEVVVDPRAPEGPVAARILLGNQDGDRLGEAFLFTEVRKPPTLLARFWWVGLILAGAAAAGLLIARRRAKERARKTSVQDLVVELRRGTSEIYVLPGRPGETLAFEVVDTDEGPILRRAAPTDHNAFVVQREGIPGRISLSDRGAPPITHQLGEAYRLDGGLSFVVIDTKAQPVGKAWDDAEERDVTDVESSYTSYDDSDVT